MKMTAEKCSPAVGVLPAAEEIAAAVKDDLSEKRWHHTECVRRQAVELARLYGADERKAELAALLHDFLKESSESQLLQIYTDNGIIINTYGSASAAAAALKRRSPAAWHGICAAPEVRQRFGICDEEILSAIDCHTCGKAGMSTLDKILYLADMTGADRAFPGVEELRVLVRQDLDTAMIRALHNTIDHVASGGGSVDGESLAALQDLEARKGEVK